MVSLINGGSRISQRRCQPLREGGTSTYYLTNFPENCMAMKKFWPGGGGVGGGVGLACAVIYFNNRILLIFGGSLESPQWLVWAFYPKYWEGVGISRCHLPFRQCRWGGISICTLCTLHTLCTLPALHASYTLCTLHVRGGQNTSILHDVIKCV